MIVLSADGCAAGDIEKSLREWIELMVKEKPLTGGQGLDFLDYFTNGSRADHIQLRRSYQCFLTSVSRFSGFAFLTVVIQPSPSSTAATEDWLFSAATA